MTAPVKVARVIDGDQFSVVISLDPARLDLTKPGHLSVTLSALEAGLLEQELYEQASPPEQCSLDERYAVVTVDGNPYCQEHARAYDDRAQVTA